APCETPFGEGLRLGRGGAVARGSAAAAAPAASPSWARRAAAPAPPANKALSPSHLLDAPPVLSARAQGRRRFRRGRLIHGLLERLPDLAPAARPAAAAAWLKARGVAAGEAGVLAAEALGVLDDPAFAAIFGPGSRAEAPIVASLANGARIAGVVDRLAVTESEVFVLDFKTDRPAPMDPAALPAGYLAQMAAYAAALRAAFPGKTVRCAFLWTEAPALMEIPAERLAETGLLG
ncbi:MAG: PD-(D/E)XK nuclease family protein, partial [Hyphomonadaceae bacterium]